MFIVQKVSTQVSPLMFDVSKHCCCSRLLRGNVLICGSLGLFDYFAALFNCLVYIIIIILPAGFNQEYLSRFLLKLASQHHI